MKGYADRSAQHLLQKLTILGAVMNKLYIGLRDSRSVVLGDCPTGSRALETETGQRSVHLAARPSLGR